MTRIHCDVCNLWYASSSNLARHRLTRKHERHYHKLRIRVRDCPIDVQWHMFKFLFECNIPRPSKLMFDMCIHREIQRGVSHGIRLMTLLVGSRALRTCRVCKCNLDNMTYEQFLNHWKDTGMCMNCLYRVHRHSNWLEHTSFPFIIWFDFARDLVRYVDQIITEGTPESFTLSLHVLDMLRWFFDSVAICAMRHGKELSSEDLTESWIIFFI